MTPSEVDRCYVTVGARPSTRTLARAQSRSTEYQHLRQAAVPVPGAELLEHDDRAAGTATVVATVLDAAGKERRV